MVFPLMDCVNSGGNKGDGDKGSPAMPEAHCAEGGTPQRAPPGGEATMNGQSVPGGSAERIAAHRFLHRLQVRC